MQQIDTTGQVAPKRRRRRLAAIALGLVALAALPALGIAHIERASYWPDPAADDSVTPPAGGSVPDVRPLATALDSSLPGTTRVVCPQPLTSDTGGGTGGGGDTGGGGSGTGGVAGTVATGSAPSHAEIDRLQAQLDAVRAKIKKAKGKKRKKLKRKARALAAQLAAAQQAYDQALAAQGGTHSATARTTQQQIDSNPSIQRLDASLAKATTDGYTIRPSQGPIVISQAQADEIRAINVQLLERCQYTSIQAAVNASGNNDRVEVMPGIYTEPASRAAPTHDPACAEMTETNDHGETGAVSYRYQYHCPNDQNLIAVIGRAPKLNPDGTEYVPPAPPLQDRQNIPDAGPCIRCNLEIQGTGVAPDDVIVDGGNPADGDHSPPGQDSRQYPKDVGIRADRADGFVLDNVKVRHVNEHDVYVTETDGFQLNRLETSYAGEYGVLTFVAVHSLIQNCAAWGNGDSGLYPGASKDMGKNADGDQIYTNELRDCDSFHNALGYSGTDGNAVWVHHNDFYENAQGLSSDVFTAAGHPGFPQHGDLIEHNNFYSNNYNPYLPLCGTGDLPAQPGPDGPDQKCSDFTPSVPVPVGTGMWWAGGNDNIVHANYFWNNWRRGTMLFAVPDQLVCGPAGVDPTLLAGCNPTAVLPSTSYGNQYYGNKMGVTPDGQKKPNGLDFWWDQYAGNTGNCWHDNTGVNGNRASLTSLPPLGSQPGTSDLGKLPEDCAKSLGTGGPQQEAELLGCFADFTFDTSTCDWFTTPPKP
jgi:hypothetical protein